MKNLKVLTIVLAGIALAACSFQKKEATVEEVPSAGTTDSMAVQPTPPTEGAAPAEQAPAPAEAPAQ